MLCRACGKEVPISGRVGFRDECPHCGADLHICTQCLFHDSGAYNECREPNAERAGDKEKANRCEYFQPTTGGPGAGSANDARAKLEALFKK